MEAPPSSSRWGPSARPRLASKVRFQWNAARNQALLLYPEGALVLNPTARAVLELCDGRRTLEEIVRELAQHFDGSGTSATSADPVPLSTDPGTSAVEPQDLAKGQKEQPGPSTTSRGAPASEQALHATREPDAAAATSAEDRVRVIERDVKSFLDRLDQRGWLVDESDEERTRSQR